MFRLIMGWSIRAMPTAVKLRETTRDDLSGIGAHAPDSGDYDKPTIALWPSWWTLIAGWRLPAEWVACASLNRHRENSLRTRVGTSAFTSFASICLHQRL
jgi:hypothetical protein